MTTAAERRRRIRVPLQQMIRHSKYQVLGTPVFEENSSIDLSSGGISFETEQEYKNGTLVLLEVQIDSEMVKLLVCIAWVKPHDGRYMIGAELIAIDPEHKKTMQTHLNRLIREVSPPKKKKKKVAVKKVAVKQAAKKSAKKKPVKKLSAKKVVKKVASKKKAVAKKKKKR